MKLMDALVPAPARMGGCAPTAWTVDVPALERACERLGLTRPVVVTIVRGRGGRRWGGLHRVERGEHVLSIVAGLSHEGASRMLWHELEHAHQCEGLGDERFHAEYRAESRAYGYEANRFEVAARRAERRHERWFALTR